MVYSVVIYGLFIDVCKKTKRMYCMYKERFICDDLCVVMTFCNVIIIYVQGTVYFVEICFVIILYYDVLYPKKKIWMSECNFNIIQYLRSTKHI